MGLQPGWYDVRVDSAYVETARVDTMQTLTFQWHDSTGQLVQVTLTNPSSSVLMPPPKPVVQPPKHKGLLERIWEWIKGRF
jgi:hypothetical protein